MSKIELYDHICIGDIDAVVSYIYDDQNVEVVYSNNGKYTLRESVCGFFDMKFISDSRPQIR